MRVTCPSCHAVYEASDAEIGVGGRVVECSACGARGMQPGPVVEPMTDPAGRSAVPGLAAAAADMAALRGRPDEDADVAAAPAAPTVEAPGSEAQADETETDEGATRDAAGEPPREAAEDPASVEAPEAIGTDPGAAAWRDSPDVAGTGAPAPVAPIASTTVAPTTPAADVAPTTPAADVAPRDDAVEDEAPRRRNRVATIDAQSLSAELRGASYEDEEESRDRSRGGLPFALGLVLALLVSAVGAVAYLQPTVIGDAIPDAYPWLDRWAEIVDRGRAAVDRVVASLADLASPLIDRIR